MRHEWNGSELDQDMSPKISDFCFVYANHFAFHFAAMADRCEAIRGEVRRGSGEIATSIEQHILQKQRRERRRISNASCGGLIICINQSNQLA